MTRLMVIVPTRHRANTNVPRFLESLFAAATTDLTVTLVTDGDDLTYEQYRASPPSRVQVVTMPGRATVVEKANHVAVPGAREGTYGAFMYIGDDHDFRTSGWDAELLGEIERMGGTGAAYGNDLLERPGYDKPLANHIIITADIVNALGYFAEPSLRHYGVDLIWTGLPAEAGCLAHRPDVIIDHLHPAWGKAPGDDLYAEMRQKYWLCDEQALAVWERERHASDLKKVRACLVR